MSGKRPRVSIISRESDKRTLDAAMLEEELLGRGIDVTVLSKLLTKDRGLRSLSYAGTVLKQEAAILRSDVVVLDTYCIPASMLPHRRGTKVIQIWHALAAIKKFGWQTVGREGGSSEKTARIMRMHRGYDYVVCASDATAEHFCEAFDVSRDRIVKYGLPRIDYIRSVSSGERREDMRRKIFSAYPELGRDGRKIVLYAPTFRRGMPVDAAPLAEAIDRERFDLVVKLHPLYRGGAGQTEGVIYDEQFPSFDWLSAADIIISDYSSFVIESTLADKPLYIYAYDLEDYDANTGLNTDFEAEPIAPYVFRDAESLAAALKEDYDMDRLRAFRDRYIDIDYEKKSCTKQLADFILDPGTDPRSRRKGSRTGGLSPGPEKEDMGSITAQFKKKVFDLAKKNKAFRVAGRHLRDAVYRAKMTADEPFAAIDDRLVYFQTFSGRGYSDSPKAMYEYMLDAPEYRDYRFVWSFKEPEKFSFLLDNGRTEIVKFRSRADNKALRRAKYWIVNYRMLDYQYPRKGQVYLQCWHGTPLKRLGYDIGEGENVMNSASEVREKYRTDAKKFAYILSPSPFTTEKFASAWNLRETGMENKIIEEGYPRNDRLVNATEEERMQIREKLGAGDKKLILYAPTWRDNQHTSGLGYTYRTEVDFDRLKEALGDGYLILFRAHYLVANSFDFARYEGFVKDVSSYPDINDLYIASDMLVTDYSSVFFDYTDLEKPVIFYMYDLDEYAGEIRGFYLSLDELPGLVVRDEDALAAEIKAADGWKPDAKYEAFRKRFNPLDDGHASERVLRRIIG